MKLSTFQKLIDFLDIFFCEVSIWHICILKIEFCVLYLLICISLYIIEWILAQYIYKHFFSPDYGLFFGSAFHLVVSLMSKFLIWNEIQFTDFCFHTYLSFLPWWPCILRRRRSKSREPHSLKFQNTSENECLFQPLKLYPGLYFSYNSMNNPQKQCGRDCLGCSGSKELHLI